MKISPFFPRRKVLLFWAVPSFGSEEMTIYVYGLIVIIIFLLVLFMLVSRRKAINLKPAAFSTNRRGAFRLKFNQTFCDFHPLISNSKQVGFIRDISSGGIRIEAQTKDLSVKSLVMLYFELQDETFIFEGMVRWKRKLGATNCQYGIKFINVPKHEQQRLLHKLHRIKRLEKKAQ
jgi:PilZ domain